MGRGGSKKCKPIPAPPRGAGLKSHPIPAPLPLRGKENPHGAKRGGAGQAGRGKIAIPTYNHQTQAQTSNKPSHYFFHAHVQPAILISLIHGL